MVIMIALMSCSGLSSRNNEIKLRGAIPITIVEEPVIKDNEIISFGEGLYYFGYIPKKFGPQLLNFIGEHKELRLIAFAPNDYEGHGHTSGYFVYFEPRDTVKVK